MKTKLLFASSLLFFAVQLFSQPNCSAPSTGFTPINDLGTGISPVTGLMGGLYPNGSNFIPSAHKTAGLQMASQIQCLDTNGKPDVAKGKIVWLSIGMSNCTQETQQFIPLANAFAAKNPKLILVDGAQGGQTASVISTPTHSNYANFWRTVGQRLTAAGVNGNQVQVIWFKEANVAGSTPIDVHHDSLVVQIKRIMRELKVRFPNIKLCYLASRISARYATTSLNPEPYSYRTGWAVKKVIEDQIKGDARLSYSGPLANSPWLAWGIYMWSDGSTAQTTNPKIALNCPADFQNDGTHPSAAGAKKVGGWLLDFFSNDSTATPWFIGTGCNSTGIEKIIPDNFIKIYPNPSGDNISIELPDNISGKIKIEIYSPLGEIVYSGLIDNAKLITLDVSQYTNGIYLVRAITAKQMIYAKKINLN